MKLSPTPERADGGEGELKASNKKTLSTHLASSLHSREAGDCRFFILYLPVGSFFYCFFFVQCTLVNPWANAKQWLRTKHAAWCSALLCLKSEHLNLCSSAARGDTKDLLLAEVKSTFLCQQKPVKPSQSRSRNRQPLSAHPLALFTCWPKRWYWNIFTSWSVDKPTAETGYSTCANGNQANVISAAGWWWRKAAVLSAISSPASHALLETSCGAFSR